MRRILLFAAAFALGCAAHVTPQAPATPERVPAPVPSAPPVRAERTESDEYTRYELLDPETAQFHILYEVTAIAPGAEVFFNPIRKGSEASGEHVTDRMSGEALRFEVVSGEEARRTGLPSADLASDYIQLRGLDEQLVIAKQTRSEEHTLNSSHTMTSRMPSSA